MSFRNISLIFITLLLTSVLLLQWWSITSFSQAVSKQVGESAFQVSRATAEKLIFEQPKIEMRSFAFSTRVRSLNDETLSRLLTQVRQDVTIELVDEQKDDYLMLNADGSEFQIPIPRTGIDESLEKFSKNVLYSTIALLVFGVLMAMFFTAKLAAPLRRLQQASAQIGDGKFGVQINDDKKWHSQEIDTTLESFNHMSNRIVELQKQNESLQNKAHLVELAEIAKGLAHTIRNPLNTLNLAVDEINSETDKDKKTELAKLAKHQIRRIDKWVKSLMDVMSSDESLITEVDLEKVIDSVVDDFQLTNQQQQKINLCTRSNIGLIRGVESELKGLLQSLIGNALEASPPASQVNIKYRAVDAGIEIQIKDQGKGFSQRILDNLFSPHNTDKTYGAGMGLYLAHRIIQYKYHGTLSVKNNKDVGSCITLVINDRG